MNMPQVISPLKLSHLKAIQLGLASHDSGVNLHLCGTVVSLRAGRWWRESGRGSN